MGVVSRSGIVLAGFMLCISGYGIAAHTPWPFTHHPSGPKCRTRKAWVTINNEHGHFLYDLNSNNFQVLAAGHRTQVLAATQPPMRHLVLILDASGSMTGWKWHTALQTAYILLQHLPIHFPVALTLF